MILTNSWLFLGCIGIQKLFGNLGEEKLVVTTESQQEFQNQWEDEFWSATSIKRKFAAIMQRFWNHLQHLSLLNITSNWIRINKIATGAVHHFPLQKRKKIIQQNTLAGELNNIRTSITFKRILNAIIFGLLKHKSAYLLWYVQIHILPMCAVSLLPSRR